MASNDSCIFCSDEVRPRQHGLLCEDCNRWQHRKCKTGITQKQYYDAMKGLIQLDWRCAECTYMEVDAADIHGPAANSTMLRTPDGPSLDNLDEDDLGNFELPSRHEEDSIGNITPEDVPEEECQEVQYEVIPTGTERGRPMLADSLGFKYTIKKPRKNRVKLTYETCP